MYWNGLRLSSLVLPGRILVFVVFLALAGPVFAQERLTIKVPSVRKWFVNAVTFSPDGRLLVTGADSTDPLRVWDAQTGEQIAALSGHTDSVYRLQFSPDGKTLAAALGDKTVQLWDTGTWKNTATFPFSSVRGLAFTPDSKTLITMNNNNWGPDRKEVSGNFVFWDSRTGKKLRSFSGHIDIREMAVSPDGKLIVSGSSMNGAGLKLWDLETGKEKLAIPLPDQWKVYAMALSPDGKIVAVYTDVSIKLWDTATGAEFNTLKVKSGFVQCMSYSPDGKLIAVDAGSDLHFLNSKISLTKAILKGQGNTIRCLAFSPDGKRIATGSSGTVKIWDVPAQD